MRFTRISGLFMIAACHPAAPSLAQPGAHFALLGGAHHAAPHGEHDASENVVMNDAGSGVAAVFEGTGIAVDLRNGHTGERIYYQVTLDGNSETLVHANTAVNRYTFDDLTPGAHHIVIRRLNGVDHGTGHLAGLVPTHDGTLVTGPEAAHRLEFVGGELTAGLGLDDMDDAFGGSTNAALSLAGQTAKGLHADYRVRSTENWQPAHGWEPHAVVIEAHEQIDLTVEKIQKAYPHADILVMVAPTLEGEKLRAARSAAAATGMTVVEFKDPQAARGDTYGHYVMARALRSALQETAHWQAAVSVASGHSKPGTLF